MEAAKHLQSLFFLVLDCGHPGAYRFARSPQFNSTRYGAVAVLRCQDGYWFDQLFESIMTIQCGADGRWEPSRNIIRCSGEEVGDLQMLTL